MERQIKFRVWHNGKMYLFDKKANYHLTFFRTGLIPWGVYHSIEENRLVTGDPSAIFNECGILMQYTGLKCRNKEIYEDDVIEFSLQDGSKEYGVVRFSDDGFWTSQDANHCEELLSEELNSKCLKPKLIGNIHQNPELFLTHELN